MIRIEGGRARSVLTTEERRRLLSRDLSNLTEDEWRVLEIALGEIAAAANTDGASTSDNTLISTIEQQEYCREMVDMETFLFDDYFMGHAGRYLWPSWVDDLIELFDPTSNYHEVILSGAIGIGKNYMASLIVARMIYEISCYRSPQRSFGLDPTDEIAFANVSVTQLLARQAVLQKIVSRMSDSPYFTKDFPLESQRGRALFPNGVILMANATRESSILSLNTFGAVFDEVNFIGTKSRITGDKVDYADVLYTSLLRRMKSRYMRGGRLPGKLIILSSKTLNDSFTERKIMDARDDPHVFVRERSLWEAKPPGTYSKERFYVFVGNGRHPNRIIEDDDRRADLQKMIDSGGAYDGAKIVDVPVDFRKDFELDLDGALQSIAGVSIDSFSPFIYRTDTVYDAIDDSRSHPMLDEEWDAGKSLHILWGKLVKEYKSIDRRGMGAKYVAPIINPTAMRHVHIDTSLKGDSTGICIGHVSHYVDVVRRDMDGKEFIERAPFIYIDFLLRVVPPAGEEIIMADIRTLLYSFMDHGFRFGLLTTDTYQSAEMRQYMERKGVESNILSVDRTTDPYMNLRMALYEHRLSYYYYMPFVEEVSKLIHDRKRDKVDHMRGESKDVADAVAGVVHSLSMNPSYGNVLPMVGISESDDRDSRNEWVRREVLSKRNLAQRASSDSADSDNVDRIILPKLG